MVRLIAPTLLVWLLPLTAAASRSAEHRPAPAAPAQLAHYASSHHLPTRSSAGHRPQAGHPQAASDGHMAAQADCLARWGKDLGSTLCPAMFAANASAAAQDVEWGLLRVLWHLSRQQAARAWQRGREAVVAWGVWLRPLVLDDPL